MHALGFLYELMETIEKVADRNHFPGIVEVAVKRDLDLQPLVFVDFKIPGPRGDVIRTVVKIDTKFIVGDQPPSKLIDEMAKKFENQVRLVKGLN